jgi:hypothetical protein
MSQDGKNDDFHHDLIIASDDGTVLHIPRDVWDRDKYRVKEAAYQSKDWQVVRELLQCGVLLAAVPPNVKPKPLGTCWLVNIEGLKKSTKFHVR